MKKLTFSFAVVAAMLFCIGTEAGAQESGKVYWRGTVDNKVHLVIHGTSLEQRTIDGQPMADGFYSFTAPLPKAEVAVKVNKIDGRGSRITVIQHPTAANDFQAIVEIIDERGGADDYLLEIVW